MIELDRCPCCADEARAFEFALSYIPIWNVSHVSVPIPRLRMVRCTNCDHRFNNPQLTWTELEPFYSKGYEVFEQEGNPMKIASSVYGNIGLSPVSGGKFLDIGCGTGALVAAMAKRGMDALGIEPSAYAVKQANALRRNVICASLEDCLFPSGQFDVISLHHVLEHTPDPREILRECYRILRRGGHVLVAVPNASSSIFARVGERWNMLEPGHLQHFSPLSLACISKTVGFSVVRLETETITWAMELAISQWLREKFMLPQRIFVTFRLLWPIAWVLAQRSSATGSGEAIVAKLVKMG